MGGKNKVHCCDIAIKQGGDLGFGSGRNWETGIFRSFQKTRVRGLESGRGRGRERNRGRLAYWSVEKGRI